MRALEKIQKVDPRCHALIVGGDDVSYGKRPQGAANWREKMLAEVKLDPARTHFLGRAPRARYLDVLKVSAAHVYLTYPFMLSWSLLEAMATGAAIVASNTAPVREMIRDGASGRLTPISEPDAVARTALEAIEDGSEVGAACRLQARADSRRFDQTAAMGLMTACWFGRNCALIRPAKARSMRHAGQRQHETSQRTNDKDMKQR